MKVKKIIPLLILLIITICCPGLSMGNTVPDPHDDSLQDIIYLKDGSELVVKIKVFGEKSLEFEQYDSEEPFFIETETISRVHLKDGKIRDLNQKKTATEPTHTKVSRAKSRNSKTKRKK